MEEDSEVSMDGSFTKMPQPGVSLLDGCEIRPPGPGQQPGAWWRGDAQLLPDWVTYRHNSQADDDCKGDEGAPP